MDNFKVSDDEREENSIEKTADERIHKKKSYDDEQYKAKDEEDDNLN